MSQLQARKIRLEGKKAKEALLAGVAAVAGPVGATFGPRSENVALARPWGVPSVIHDGVGVARETVPLKDPFQNVGAEIIVEAASKTGDVGDGTTATTIMTESIFTKAHEVIAAGNSTMSVRRGIERAVALVSAKIHELALPIDQEKDGERLQQVAYVSAQLPDLGDMVVKAVKKVGADGVITVEESQTSETTVEVKQGMELERGYKSHYFMTDRENSEAVVEQPHVLVTDERIDNMEEFLPVLNKAINEMGVKNLLIIADDIDGEPLATLVINHLKGNFRAIAVQAPNFGDKRHAILEDIAILTGATLVTAAAGLSLKEFQGSYLGKAALAKSSDKTTIIVGGEGDEKAVAERAVEIKKKADHPDTNPFEREKLLERYAKLTTGVAVVHIGGRSEPEMKERKERAIDAIAAVKAAAAEGIVPGGGTALLRAAEAVREKNTEGDTAERAGFNLVLEACKAPYYRLLTNSGLEPGRYIDQLLSDEKGTLGVDVTTGEVVDLLERGIIDPAKVIRAALDNGASAGVILSTISHVIVEEPVESKDVTQY